MLLRKIIIIKKEIKIKINVINFKNLKIFKTRETRFLKGSLIKTKSKLIAFKQTQHHLVAKMSNSESFDSKNVNEKVVNCLKIARGGDLQDS